jgi:hypothetical protein
MKKYRYKINCQQLNPLPTKHITSGGRVFPEKLIVPHLPTQEIWGSSEQSDEWLRNLQAASACFKQDWFQPSYRAGMPNGNSLNIHAGSARFEPQQTYWLTGYPDQGLLWVSLIPTEKRLNRTLIRPLLLPSKSLKINYLSPFLLLNTTGLQY